MTRKKRKLISGGLNSMVIAILLVAMIVVPANVSAQGLVYEWSWDTGSDVLCIDISDGSPTQSEVYVAAGSTHNLSLFDGDGNLEWYDDDIQTAEYWAYGNSHAVAISGNAQYVAVGDINGTVHVYNIYGTKLWSRNMGFYPAYSVDVSNPHALLQWDNYDAFVVSCSGSTFYVFNASTGSLLWSRTLTGAGSVINVRISENGDWIGVSTNYRRIEFHNNTVPRFHQMVWSYTTTDNIVNLDIGRVGIVVVAGEDDPSNQGTSNVYEFDAGTDWTWGTLDDQVPRWSRAEPNDIYAVAVSDSDLVAATYPPFSVISGKTWGDNESEESYYTSSTKIRNWPTGLVCRCHL
ncbi:MAG: PQQ-binding-like beta-propeller repeat protein [Thermoplasmata archaeon]|nr:MAG: PQQ-binding-like beta-propeller repeat protein [Thermoplasmata archaeon]